MKTAVSLPDDLFRQADKQAKRLGISRSELYARALQRFLEQRRSADITAALDRVYADGDAGLDPTLAELQRRTWQKERW